MRHQRSDLSVNTASPSGYNKLVSWRVSLFVRQMYTLIFLFTLCVFLLGCAAPIRDVSAVWTQPTAPPTDLPPPYGFTVSPLQAYSAIWDSRALSMKHVCHIYADSRYYYIHDTFLGDSPRRALAQGVRIDGQTGEIAGRMMAERCAANEMNFFANLFRKKSAMTLKEFADMTIEVNREDGIQGYLPTFVLPDTKEVLVIQGIPDDVDHREAVQNVIRRSGYETREFFFGVQSGPQQITIGHFRPGKTPDFMEITETPEGYSTSTLESLDWWRVA